MDFFQAQDKARQSTTRLVIMFGFAVITLMLITNVFVMAVLSFYSGSVADDVFSVPNVDAFTRVFDWQIFIGVSLAVFLIVFFGSLYKILSLSTGGKVVAEMLGGQRIPQDTRDPDARKVLNVVEEMAIASGTPMPSVYMLSEEQGINAFAAGNSSGDAIIGVTQGCVSLLNRDQLQGVIAHEFSHIINGDMRLNIRIMGILHGILVIGMIGYYLLRSTSHSRRRESGGAQLALGLGLMVIGYAGSFFGSMIKASVSRQREYFADASAVQFTRNPDGIANALKKIGGYSHHSNIENPSASGISHTFFATGINSLFTDVFATHPPLQKRIRSIQPSWNGKFPTMDAITQGREKSQGEMPGSLHKPLENNVTTEHASSLTQTIVAAAAMEAISSIGQPSLSHLGYAANIRNRIPQSIRAGIREPYSARAVIYALIISDEDVVQRKQMKYLENHADKGVYAATSKFLSEVKLLNATLRLPLIDMATATLRELSPQQYQKFKKNFQMLIEADNKINLFEWAIKKILFQYLDADFIKQPILARTSKYSSINALLPECIVVLSLLAYSEHREYTSAKIAFDKGAKALGSINLEILAKDKLSLNELNLAVDKLTLLKPLVKPQFLKACAACITSDNNITPAEMELLRAFSAALACPMPPIIVTDNA